ncbi:Las1-domain-containing protein [Thozetella sp. PMI_491]|nr:Las1-domain-containing protein [Thozetella sp. PMI_491]
MVQYVFTPWRDRQELLKVRRQFYPQRHPQTFSEAASFSSPPQHGVSYSQSTHRGTRAKSEPSDGEPEVDSRAQQHEAVARVSMWMQRGSCPHLVESTALLTAAILSDQQAAAVAAATIQRTGESEMGYGVDAPVSPSGSLLLSSSMYAARAAYSTAFSRFVTGLLDSHQDRQHKMSMYAIAKSVGLPATFVELRHQATHEQLPSLTRLRFAAQKALDWIYDYYWQHLTDAPETGPQADQADQALGSTNAALRSLIEQFLEEEDVASRTAAKEDILNWRDGTQAVIIAVDSLLASSRDTRKLKLLMGLLKEATDRSMKLGGLGDGDAETPTADPTRDPAVVRAELEKLKQELEETKEENSAQTGDSDKLRVDEDESEKPGWSRHEGPWVPKPIGTV